MDTITLRSYGIVLARVLLGLLFIVSGFGVAFDIAGTATAYAAMGIPMATAAAILAAIIKIGGGLAVALGIYARIGAWALIAFTIIATLLAHIGEGQLPAALKNLSVVGGFLLIALGAGTEMSLQTYLSGRKSSSTSDAPAETEPSEMTTPPHNQ